MNQKFKTFTLLTFLTFYGLISYSQSKGKLKSIENQYNADLGNGYFVNPILRGNYADPTVLRDGNNYYLTHSSFDNIPGLLIWQSQDLINWMPIANALTDFVGGVWAPDLIKYRGLFYIYFPAGGTNWVVTAKNPVGPWSKPIDLKIGGIDPGHVAGQDGKRYLHLAGGNMVSLADDGLSVTSNMKMSYEGWHFPKEWIVECFCLESPKFTYHNGYYYITAAEGGTAGPATSHMVVSARSKTPFGPWENSPYNPIVRNTDRNNKWASTGHGTIVDSPDGKWWILFHGFENANKTIGRQNLLLPLEWTNDGWYKVPANTDVAKPLKKPVGKAVIHGMQISDNFEGNQLGSQWNVLKNEHKERFIVKNGTLTIKSLGKSIPETQPLTVMPGNDSYKLTVELGSCTNGSSGGLLLYYNEEYYAGLEFDNHTLYRVNYKGQKNRVEGDIKQDMIYIRLVNDHNDLLYYYSLDGKDWTRLELATQLSGYETNTLGGWGYLKPALFSIGDGEVKFKNFQYEGLDGRH